MRLKELRLERGLSQSDVACGIGCSPVVYSRYETGSRQPSIDMLISLAKFFNVTTDFLLELDTNIITSKTTINSLSDREKEVVTTFRNLSHDNKDIIIGKAKELLREQQQDKAFLKDAL